MSRGSVTDDALAKLRAAHDAMPDPFLVVSAVRDPYGAVVDFAGVEANAAACRFMGREEQEMVGVCLTSFMPPEPAAGCIDSFRRVLVTAGPLVIDRLPVPNGPAGAIGWYDARAVRIDADHVGFTWRVVTVQVEQQRAAADLLAMEALIDERDRLARDLHDGAIQQVYGTGMMLAVLRDRAPEPLHADFERLIAAQDEIIRQLRATILGLVRPDLDGTPPLVMIEHLVAEAQRSLGLMPRLVSSGDVDGLDDPVLLQHVLFSLREMLSNVARHAEATAVEVIVEVGPERVAVRVDDDGVGLGPTVVGGYGLSNLAKRAGLLGGSFHLEERNPSGTSACWAAARGTARC
jgi:signal transduction histidine kinase